MENFTFIEYGHKDFGENKVQRLKMDDIKLSNNATVHLIGGLQTNVKLG